MDSGDQNGGKRDGRRAAREQRGAGDDASQAEAGGRVLDEAVIGDDQELSDRDQTASDSDQTSSEQDQTSSDADKRASFEDQSASDLETAEGSGQRARDLATVRRQHAEGVRIQDSAVRLRTGRERDITAADRDDVASGRDRGAAARDEAANRPAESSEGVFPESPEEREAKRDRRQAADARRAAAEVREVAARNRQLATARRTEPAHGNRLGGFHGLTDVLPRENGMSHLAREILVKQRMSESPAVVVIRVNGPDARALPAGDELVDSIARVLSEALRPMDVVMRFADDEFVCVISDADERSQQHIADLVGGVASQSPAAQITIGNAEFVDGDSAMGMVQRAARNAHPAAGEP